MRRALSIRKQFLFIGLSVLVLVSACFVIYYNRVSKIIIDRSQEYTAAYFTQVQRQVDTKCDLFQKQLLMVAYNPAVLEYLQADDPAVRYELSRSILPLLGRTATFNEGIVDIAIEDPDGDGIENTVGLSVAVVGFLWSQGFPNYGFTDARWIKDDDGKYRLGNTTRSAFELFKFIRLLYQRGGLDPDFAISSQDPAIDQFASGHAGALLRQISPKHLNKVYTAWSKLQPDISFEENIEILKPWKVRGLENTAFVEKSYWSESYIEASVDDRKMAKILALFDFLYSDEGIALSFFGFRDRDFSSAGNEIQLLRRDEDGKLMNSGDLYPIMGGGFAYLAVWSDIVQYIDPSIPPVVTAMARKEREHRLAEWKRPVVDWTVEAINVPEKQALGIEFGADWIKFILDDSGRTEEELYGQMIEHWRANGYDAAVEAVTEAAKRIGRQ